MWLMGTDFRYQYANSWFRQMDKFIHYVNKVLFFILSDDECIEDEVMALHPLILFHTCLMLFCFQELHNDRKVAIRMLW